jgi:hypothetical protein
MRKGFIRVLLLAACLPVINGCNNSGSNKKAEGEAIVLGDPSTIVTEVDSAHLRDMVADLKPVTHTIPAPAADTAKKPDTVATAKTAAVPEPKEAQQQSGLTIAFKEVKLLLPGVTAKLAGNTKLEKSNSATYQLTGGNINGNSLQISGAPITNVSMRYQSGVNIKNNLGTLELDDLGSTSGWKAIKGNGNNYPLSGLEPSKLATAKVTQNSVRNAISKEARQRRMNRKTQQQWQNSVKNVRGANQKPLETVLRAVMFKIDGKDKAGKSFSKQVRIDL